MAARLKREALVLLPENDERVALAKKADELLGYKRFGQKIGANNTLTRALAELKIKPYTLAAVAAYKARQQRKRRAEEDKHRQRWTTLRVNWKVGTLANYKGDVPEFVLRKAVQIKERLPEAELLVEELTVTKTQTRRTGDPFLIAKLGTERHYIEVWDEAEFEAEVIDE